MKCVKCGTELKDGCLYCSACGHEAQLVNDVSVLEEEYLRAILSEDANEKKKKEQEKETGQNNHLDSKKNKKKAMPWILFGCIVCFAAIAIVSSVAYIRYKNNHSYDYQMEMAKKEQTDRNYEYALSYYNRAIMLLPDDIDARIAMAEIYLSQKEYDRALVLYTEILTIDEKNKTAYEGLIAIYDKQRQYDKIEQLSKDVTDVQLLTLFSEYIVADPLFYPSSGTYDIFSTVAIRSIEHFDIYYTLDGTDPRKEGILYGKEESDGIVLNELDSYTIQAVCRSEKGIYSDVVTAKYKTRATAPDYPTVTPDGGTFVEPTFVTIQAQSGCSIYYTWDGTDPSGISERYTGPIEIPKGNNILSITVINNKTKLMSEIYRANFIYEPAEEDVEETQ